MKYPVLPRYPVTDEVVLPNAGPNALSYNAFEQPALSMMTDLNRTQAVTVKLNASLDEAKDTMLWHGVRMLFVLNGQHIAGLITSTDVLGEKPLQFALKSHLKLSELLVRHLMTPRDRLEVLDMKDVARAKAGGLVATMKQSGRNHALVVYRNRGCPVEICGIFSAAVISRRLKIEFNNVEIAHSFAEIKDRLLHG